MHKPAVREERTAQQQQQPCRVRAPALAKLDQILALEKTRSVSISMYVEKRSCQPIGQVMWRHSVSRLHAQQPHPDNPKLVFLTYESLVQHASPLRSRTHERCQKDSRGESVETQKTPFLFPAAFSVTASHTWLFLQANKKANSCPITVQMKAHRQLQSVTELKRATAAFHSLDRI